MKKQEVYLVDIYKITNARNEVYFSGMGCEAGHVITDQVLVEKDVPALKFHNTYVPLKHMKKFIEYIRLKLKDNSTISYYDSRYLDEWVHIYASYNQRIAKNVRPVFQEKGFIRFSKLQKQFKVNQSEETRDL